MPEDKLFRHTITVEILYKSPQPVMFEELRDVDDFARFDLGSVMRIWEDAVEVDEKHFADRCEVHNTNPELYL